jgi:hypothetical protein
MYTESCRENVLVENRVRLAGIAQRYSARLRPGWWGVSTPSRSSEFFFDSVSRPALGPIQPPIQWVPGTLYLEVKRPEHESDHSSPSSTKVKNSWSYTSTPPNTFMVLYLVTAQWKIYLYFISLSLSLCRSVFLPYVLCFCIFYFLPWFLSFSFIRYFLSSL